MLENVAFAHSGLFVGPAIGSMQQCADVIDFTRMIQIMGDHDADDHAGWQAVAPIGEALTL